VILHSPNCRVLRLACSHRFTPPAGVVFSENLGVRECLDLMSNSFSWRNNDPSGPADQT